MLWFIKDYLFGEIVFAQQFSDFPVIFGSLFGNLILHIVYLYSIFLLHWAEKFM